MPVPPLPSTPARPVRERLHGVDMIDPYRWLEPNDTEVGAWTDAQNARTRSVLDGLPGRADIERRLRPLMEVGEVGLPAVRGTRYFYGRRDGSQDQPIHVWRDGHDGADRVLIDPHVLDPSGLTTVEWTSPSPDGRLLAYGTYRAGDENTTLHLLDVDACSRLPLEIAGKTQAPQWLPDSGGFIYQNLADAGDPYTGQVRFHRRGTDPAADRLLFRQYTREEDPKLATTWGPFASLSRDGRWLLLGYWTSTRSNDAWLVDFDRVLDGGAIDRRTISAGTDGTVAGVVVDGTLFLQTTKGAPNGRVVAARTDDPSEASWRDVVPERADATLESVAFGSGRMAVTWLTQASNVIEIFDLEGRSLGRLRMPGIGSSGIATELDRREAFVRFTSFNTPTTIYRVDLGHPDGAPAIWARPEVPVDPDGIEVEQVWYRSKDGTRISMFLIRRKGLEPRGDAPSVLYGYGGFNISLTPSFSAPLVQWFEAGGLYAVPNLRGGGEYGDRWHEAGMLDRKQNVFDDYIAAAEWLVEEGWTTPQRLAMAGGSNGGLLVGAAITQRPDLCRAAIIGVPLLDMLRYQDFLMARYWVPEYGSAEDAAQFRYLRAYSPYHRVEPGTAYPAVLLTAGEHDTRVHPMHARKMAAALQAATTSDAVTRPVLLWVDREAGHGQGKPLNLRLRDAVDQRAFLMWQLGV